MAKKYKKNHLSLVIYRLPKNKGFTLVELLIVMAIIGILAGIVLVSMKPAVDRTKKSSAITTASSILPELVTCLDDGGDINAPASVSAGGGPICAEAGHLTEWPSFGDTGWEYSGVVATTITSTYEFDITDGSDTVTCSLASNGCDD